MDAIRSGFSVRQLFSAGEVGVWYDPSDLTTMFADSAGTTAAVLEGPVGLILDKSKGLTLGAELVTNGDFSGGATGWLAREGSSLSNPTGCARVTPTYTAANYGGIQLNPTVFVAGKTYLITLDMKTNINGKTIQAVVGGAFLGNISAVKTHTFRFTVPATNTLIMEYSNQVTVEGDYFEIDNISVRELPGAHASQATAASRPTLSQRVNLLTKTESFDDAVWVKDGSTIAANSTTAPDGTLTADTLIESATTAAHRAYQAITSIANCTKSVIAKKKERSWVRIEGTTSSAYFNLDTGVVGAVGAGLTASITSLGDGWYKCSASVAVASTFFVIGVASADNTPSYTGDGTSGIYIWGASLVPADQASLPYQRVNTATDYDASSVFPRYLRMDGVDDSMSTASIDFTATDKMTVVAGVRKLSDAAAGMVVELSAAASLSNGAFYVAAPDSAGTYGFGLRGTASISRSPSTYTQPITNVLSASFDIAQSTAATELTMRVNATVPGTIAASGSADAGTGNFGNYPLYIGSRAGTSVPFNGQLYSLVIRGASSTAAQITSAETYVNQKTGAY